MVENLELLTLADLKAKLRMGTSTIYRRMDAGDIPQPLVFGRTVRWVKAEIDEYTESQPRRSGRPQEPAGSAKR